MNRARIKQHNRVLGTFSVGRTKSVTPTVSHKAEVRMRVWRLFDSCENGYYDVEIVDEHEKVLDSEILIL